jgi:Tfp pilus assembly protein PilN
MAGINLLEQLNRKQEEPKFVEAGAASPAPKKFKISFPSDPGDDVKLFVRFMITAGIFGIGYFFFGKYTEEKVAVLQTELTDIKKDLDKETAKKAKLRSIGEEMKGYQIRVDELKGKLAAVMQKDNNRAYLVKALEYVATEMPKEVWFDEINANRGDADKVPSQIKFSGYALNAQAVSEFILKLDSSVYFPGASLESLAIVPETTATSNSKTIPIPLNSRKFNIMAKLGE